MIALVLALQAGGAAGAAPGDAGRPDFMSEVKRTSADYDAITKANVALLDDGRIEDSNRALLEKVPDAKRTAAHWFVLGNVLFRQDFALSYRLHQKAHELAPTEPLVAYEWAIECQRKGEWAEAEKLYETLDAAGPMAGNKQLAGLRSECLLRLGRTAEAVVAWKSAVSGEHGPIEDAFFWVHGPANPWVRRAPLLAKAKSGDAHAGRRRSARGDEAGGRGAQGRRAAARHFRR